MLEDSITLVGFMGAGKTTISEMMVDYFLCDLISLDSEIEIYENKKISNIFSEFGEEYFRNIESKILNNISYKKNIILDLGGGTFIRENNRKILKENNIKSIFLNVSFDAICKRLENQRDYRPLLSGDDWKNTAKKIFDFRYDFYKMADFTIDVNDGDSIKVVFENVLKYCNSK
mgnify:CR=1 FL=1